MSNLLFLLILLPVLAALACLFVPSGAVRRLVVTITSGVLCASSVALLLKGDVRPMVARTTVRPELGCYRHSAGFRAARP